MALVRLAPGARRRFDCPFERRPGVRFRLGVLRSRLVERGRRGDQLLLQCVALAGGPGQGGRRRGVLRGAAIRVGGTLRFVVRAGLLKGGAERLRSAVPPRPATSSRPQAEPRTPLRATRAAAPPRPGPPSVLPGPVRGPRRRRSAAVPMRRAPPRPATTLLRPALAALRTAMLRWLARLRGAAPPRARRALPLRPSVRASPGRPLLPERVVPATLRARSTWRSTAAAARHGWPRSSPVWPPLPRPARRDVRHPRHALTRTAPGPAGPRRGALGPAVPPPPGTSPWLQAGPRTPPRATRSAPPIPGTAPAGLRTAMLRRPAQPRWLSSASRRACAAASTVRSSVALASASARACCVRASSSAADVALSFCCSASRVPAICASVAAAAASCTARRSASAARSDWYCAWACRAVDAERFDLLFRRGQGRCRGCKPGIELRFARREALNGRRRVRRPLCVGLFEVRGGGAQLPFQCFADSRGVRRRFAGLRLEDRRISDAAVARSDAGGRPPRAGRAPLFRPSVRAWRGRPPAPGLVAPATRRAPPTWRPAAAAARPARRRSAPGARRLRMLRGVAFRIGGTLRLVVRRAC